MDIIKETTIEYIENIYALSINYLKNDNSIELKNMLKELELIEDKIIECEDTDVLNKYRRILKQIIDRIEGILNE